MERLAESPNAGIVHEDIDAPIGGLDVAGKVFNGLERGDVALECLGAVAQAGNGLRR
jgi:hypothetical protein